MNYMEQVLLELRERYGLDDEAVDFVKRELIQSFKNGLKRGSGREKPANLDSRRGSPRLSRKHAERS